MHRLLFLLWRTGVVLNALSRLKETFQNSLSKEARLWSINVRVWKDVDKNVVWIEIRLKNDMFARCMSRPMVERKCSSLSDIQKSGVDVLPRGVPSERLVFTVCLWVILRCSILYHAAHCVHAGKVEFLNSVLLFRNKHLKIQSCV